MGLLDRILAGVAPPAETDWEQAALLDMLRRSGGDAFRRNTDLDALLSRSMADAPPAATATPPMSAVPDLARGATGAAFRRNRDADITGTGPPATDAGLIDYATAPEAAPSRAEGKRDAGMRSYMADAATAREGFRDKGVPPGAATATTETFGEPRYPRETLTGWEPTVTPAAPETLTGWSPAVGMPTPSSAPSAGPTTAPGTMGGGASERTPTAWDRFGAFIKAPGLIDGIFAAGDLDRRMAEQNATIRAISAKLGDDPAIAREIANNPEAFRAALPLLFQKPSDPKLQDGYDAQGRKTSYMWNPATKKWEQVGGSGPTDDKAPSGWRWKDPANPRAGVEKIPGHEDTIPGEVAGRIAMMDMARKRISDTRAAFERPWGPVDVAKWTAGNIPYVGDVAPASGDIGIAQRDIRTGIEAALRTMTGAAAPEQEVSRYMAMFMPGPKDTQESAKQKLDGLMQFMEQARKLVMQGRSGGDAGLATPATPSPAAASRTRAHNPTTGEVVEWNGKEWVRAR